MSWNSSNKILLATTQTISVLCDPMNKTFCEMANSKYGKFGSCISGKHVFDAKQGNKLIKSDIYGNFITSMHLQPASSTNAKSKAKSKAKYLEYNNSKQGWYQTFELLI